MNEEELKNLNLGLEPYLRLECKLSDGEIAKALLLNISDTIKLIEDRKKEAKLELLSKIISDIELNDYSEDLDSMKMSLIMDREKLKNE
jgi:hypothetical protein